MPFDRSIKDFSTPLIINDNSKIIKKYSSRKLKLEPTDEQKYREYLTYKQPILDEAIYVSLKEKEKSFENEKKIFEFIQNLKNKRNLEETNKALIKQDITPTIQTDFDLIKFDKPVDKPSFKTREEFKSDLLGDLYIDEPVKQDLVVDKKKKKREIGIDIGGLIADEIKNQKKVEDINKTFDEAIKEESANKIKNALKAKKANKEFLQKKKAVQIIQDVGRDYLEKNRIKRINQEIDDQISMAPTEAEKEELNLKRPVGRPRKPRNPVGRPRKIKP